GGHGGGAFSGKDPSKVDRSAAYATRHIAKNLVAAGVADELLVQISYAIGVKDPIGIYVNTYGTSKIGLSDSEIAQKIHELFDMTPYGIETRLKLRNPLYSETAAYGHMGREPRVVTKTFENSNGETTTKEVELFTWEKLDYVDKIKAAFGLSSGCGGFHLAIDLLDQTLQYVARPHLDERGCAVFNHPKDCLGPPHRSGKLFDQVTFYGFRIGICVRIDILVNRASRLIELHRFDRCTQFLFGGFHQRRVERAADVEFQCTFCSRFEQQFARFVHTGYSP